MMKQLITRDTFLDELLAQLKRAGGERWAIDYTERARAAIEGRLADFTLGDYERRVWRKLGGQGHVALSILRELPVLEPACLVSMGTLCCGHARGAPARVACNVDNDAPHYKDGILVETRPRLRFLEQSTHVCPDIELGKRQHVPYVVASSCPSCRRRYEQDLSRGDHYLSYPTLGGMSEVYFCCDDDGTTWQVGVRVDLRLTLIEDE